MKTFVEQLWAGDGLGLGNPLQTSQPKNAAPVDYTNLGPAAKKPPKQARQPGAKGKSPTITGISQSPSEEVSAPEEGGDLKDNPFDNEKKPGKLPRKKGAGNPGEVGDKDFKTNLWVPAGTTQEAFARWFKATYGANWRVN